MASRVPRALAAPLIGQTLMPPRPSRHLFSALLACVVASLALSSAAHAASAPAGYRPFAPDSIWNLPLRADAPLDPNSAGYLSWLQGEFAAKGQWINTTRCAMPIYWADASTPKTTVRIGAPSYQDKALLRAWSAVPIPANAAPSNCSDQNFAVVQTQPDGTQRSWEFWRAVKNSDGTWTARWGGANGSVSQDPGMASKWMWTDPAATLSAERQSHPSWNVTASSLSMMAGVITRTDIAQGRIDHALAIAIPDTAKGRFMWPAQRSDGASLDANALPVGARLRLDPKVDLSKITMTPLVRMMAEAAQRYGIVLRDRTWSTSVFYTEEVRPGESDPFKAALAGKYPDAALKAFPWASLKVLAAPACVATPGCVPEERAQISLSSTRMVDSPLTVDTSNSWLDQPRVSVKWDFDGNGTFEYNAGPAVKASFSPASAGPLTIGVQITTRSGSVVTRKRTVEIEGEPAPETTPQPAPEPASSEPVVNDLVAPATAPETMVHRHRHRRR